MGEGFTIIYDGNYHNYNTSMANAKFGDLTVSLKGNEVTFKKGDALKGQVSVKEFEKPEDEFVVIGSGFSFYPKSHIYYYKGDGNPNDPKSFDSKLNVNLHDYLSVRKWKILIRNKDNDNEPISKSETAKNVKYLSKQEAAVVKYTNEARLDPSGFAKKHFEPIKSSQKKALDCYNALISTRPMPPLQPSKKLTLAADAHAIDMGKSGKTGHDGTDGSKPFDRMKKFGKFKAPFATAENCAYGIKDPLKIVLQLLMSKPHRENILRRKLTHIGVAIEPHKKYKHNCVQTFATQDPK